MDINELLKLCIENLEHQGLKVGNALEDLKTNHKRIAELRELLYKFKISKISAAYEYESSSTEEKQKIRDMINSVLGNENQTDQVLSELTNLFFLKKEGLLELDEVAPQVEQINRTLESLINTLEAYIERFDIKNYEKKVQSLSNEMEKIMSLGTTLSSIQDNDRTTIIDNISFFKSVVEQLDVKEEDKIKLIIYAINHNNLVYDQELQKREKKIRTELKRVEEVVTAEIDNSKLVTSIPQEVLDEIEKYMTDPEVIKRIVRIINEGYKTIINFKELTEEEKEIIEESIALARETIIKSLLENNTLSPYEALQQFYDEYDLTSKKTAKELREILKNTSRSTLSERSQQLLIRQSYQFVRQNEAIESLESVDKDTIKKNMKEKYSDYRNRIKHYKDKLKSDISSIKNDAAYEIKCILDLLEGLDSNEDDAELLMSKATKRLEEIFKSLYEIMKNDDKKDIEDREGTLFFLTKSEDKTVLEDEINFGSNNKGVSPTYYSEIKNQLQSIEGRLSAPSQSKLVNAKDLKLTKKYATRYTTGNRTQVLFIPYGKSDAIVVTASFITKKGSYKEGLEDIIKKYKEQIESLKERLDNEDSYKEEVTKAKRHKERIFKALDNYQEESINDFIERMLNDESAEENTSKVRK